ncbi:MAG: glycosyl transferase [Pseudoalteromonas sp.]|uniref:glycosyltransferase family 2 protein n=1 Tax=Pseudoalteromonas sp. TaxID=53249 RepID=UPI000C8BE013|nr:glycosyltransferase family 2 protein [Pseudoalteromonas sp.]MAD04754.1 glycosyl transferase [Pseudoalteromonas sp.]|tara:strand:+ start:4640 stop:5410 length:771 start_codon:yes stop_codon:yes gene_type:complete
MKEKIKVSVFIITLNEEKNIRRLLESTTLFDEIILVDSGSTDKTVEIAKEYGAKTYYKEWMGYAQQKQYALSLCTNIWVMNLDADEELTNTTMRVIKRVLKENKYEGVRFKRNDFFINGMYSKFTKKPNNLRLYKKENAHFNESTLVHESATVKGKELYVNEAFNHYGYNSIHILTDKSNQYSTLKSTEKFKKNKSSNFLKLGLVFPITFIKKYIIQGFVFSGRRGFIQSVIALYYAFLKEAKLFELEKKEDQLND